MLYAIGLDIGSSGVKSTVFDVHANVISYAYREYDIHCPGEQMYTLFPADIIKNSFEVLRESAEKSGVAAYISAISISSIGESFVCLDENDNSLFDIMLYMDKRGTKEIDELLGQISRETIYENTGCYVDPMYAVYKLRWIAKHHPEVLDKTEKICFIADYVGYMLGAEHCCEYSLATRSGLLQINEKKWWSFGLDFASIKEKMMPKLASSGSIVGTVSAKASQNLGGIAEGTPIILGGHDQIMTIIGSGANQPGDVVNGMGTVDCLTGIVGEDADKTALLNYNMPLVPFLDKPYFATYAFNMSGGINNKWFRNELAKDLCKNGNAYAQLNNEVPDKPSSLIYLPYLCGSGTPNMDATTPAIIAGLRIDTSRGEIFRAFLEGTSYEMKSNLECLRKVSGEAKQIVAVGGGASSKLWLQIRADIFGKEIHIPEYNEAGTLANAILCYTALGIFNSIEDAQREMVRYKETYRPRDNNVEIYQRNFEKYQRFYKLAKEFYM